MLTISTTVFLYRRRRSTSVRVLLGPAAVMLWLFVAADGMTPKTWQHGSEDHPMVSTTSRRHALMKSWYELCERTFGAHQR